MAAKRPELLSNYCFTGAEGLARAEECFGRLNRKGRGKTQLVATEVAHTPQTPDKARAGRNLQRVCPH